MLQLDVTTMVIADIAITVAIGATLLFTWLQNRAVQPLGWWGAAHVVMASGISLLLLADSDGWLLVLGVGVTLILLSFAIMWSAARQFDGRKFLLAPMLAGPGLWFAAVLVNALPSNNAYFALFAAINALYCYATSWEFWRGRGERLMTRWPAIALFAISGTGFLSWIAFNAVFPYAPGEVGIPHVWFGPIVLVTVLGKISVAIAIVAMAKERLELRQRIAALTDPLTGLPNRRSFFRAAARRLRPQKADPQPMSVLMFDLDGFKAINDRYGHGFGDLVLKQFAETLSDSLQASDVIGRMGGEEFAALLPATTLEDAAGAAERVRAAFAAEIATIEGEAVGATVSVGVASAADRDCNLHELLARADRALYQAKERGRNRVEVSADRERRVGARAPDLVPELEGADVPAAPRLRFDIGGGSSAAAASAGTRRPVEQS